VTPAPPVRRDPAARDPRIPLRVTVTSGRRYRLSVFDLGLACCALEFVAAAMSRPDLLRPQLLCPRGDPGGASAVDVLVVSGTVTDKMAPLVLRAHAAMPEPRLVLSFGACANTGGPYWDSYCVTKGVDRLLPVDVYVPGCPPRPEALLDGLLALGARLDAAAAPGTP